MSFTVCGSNKRHERAERQRRPRRDRTVERAARRDDGEHRGAPQRRRRRADGRDVGSRDAERRPSRPGTRHAERLEHEQHGSGDDRDVQAGNREDVNEAGRGKAIARVRRDRAHVGDEQCADQRRVGSEERVDARARAEPPCLQARTPRSPAARRRRTAPPSGRRASRTRSIRCDTQRSSRIRTSCATNAPVAAISAHAAGGTNAAPRERRGGRAGRRTGQATRRR